ncbi:MAG: four-carbon acid sugar kinase family protein [Oscillospiraceae bacterium]
MPRCVVVADDLTGANATGVLLKKNGFDTLTLLRPAMDRASVLSDCDCLVLPTDSRAIPAGEAYDRVKEALELLGGPDVLLYSKRVDSTLRGNLGSETDAFLDTLGNDYLAVCVPCFPSSGRVLIGGHLLVNGVPLRKTEAASDPMCPISTSEALEIFSKQSKYPAAAIYLDDVHDGAAHLSSRIEEKWRDGVRILLIDSVTEEDMETIADALIKTGIRVVTVDPGPFTAIMGRRLLPAAPEKPTGKIMCAIGSVNGVAGAQTRRLLKKLPVLAVYMDTAQILESEESRSAEIDRLAGELIARSGEADILAVIGCGIDPTKRVPFEPYMEKRGLDAEGLSELINTAFAEVTMRVLEANPDFRGVYSTGGDITAAIHSAAGTVGLRLLDEVVPLAGYGIAIGGKLSGKAFISKGGMVGDEAAMVTCVTYLQKHIS